jgi:retron-type reverse transcriptase
MMMKTILEYFAAENLEALYFDQLESSQSVGVDGITNELFSNRFDEEVEIIQRKVANESIDFSLYKEKLISKGRNSNPRAISIPTNRDKLVLKVLHGYLKGAFDDAVSVDNIHSKIKGIKNIINVKNYDCFIKVDIQKFFPSIDHEILKRLLRKKISDHVALNLIDKAITQSTVSPEE